MEQDTSPADDAIIHASSDEILTYILSATPSDRRLDWIKKEGSRYSVQIDYAWRSGNLVRHGLPTSPEFTESTDPRSFATSQGFRDAIYTELLGRNLQREYYRSFEEVAETTDSPDQFGKLVDVYGFLYEHTKSKERLTPGPFARLLVHRAVEYIADKETGDASPAEAAEVVLPAIKLLLDQQYRSNPGKAQISVNTQFSADLLGRGVVGTAEHTAGLRLREMLRESGYGGFGQTDAAKRLKYKVSERYVTASTLEAIKKSEGEAFAGLPESSRALEVIQSRIIQTVQELSATNNIAGSIAGAIKRLRAERDPFTQHHVHSLNTLINLANALTPNLNARESLTGELALQKLDEHDHTELKYAFQRILFAIDPQLLSEAVEGPVKSGPKLRLRMAYIEALSQQWVDYRRVQGPTIGDFVIRMKARGLTNEEIADRINKMDRGRPDKRATENFYSIVRDPETKKNRVVYSKFKSGYGVYS